MATKTAKKSAAKKTTKKAAPKKKTAREVTAPTVSSTDAKPTKKAAKAKAPRAVGKLSALDAAAKVLSSSKEPLNTKQMIELMASKGLWTSPGGATPWATLYSAILREIQMKGKESRFTKTERGHFAAKA